MHARQGLVPQAESGKWVQLQHPGHTPANEKERESTHEGKKRQQKTRGNGNGKLNNTNNLQQMTWHSSSPRFPDLTKTT